MEPNSQNEHEDQSTSKNTSILSAGEKFWLELKAMPYNEDMVGQAEVMNFSQPPRKETKPKDDGTTM